MRAVGTSPASAVIGAILAHLTIHLGGSVLPSAGAFSPPRAHSELAYYGVRR